MTHSYFVVCEDFGSNGLEAVVDPWETRQRLVERIRDKDFRPINFIHHIHDGVCEDVTNELLAEAGFYETVET
jgi:hypothetical protein